MMTPARSRKCLPDAAGRFGRRPNYAAWSPRRPLPSRATALWQRAKATPAPEGQLRSSHGRKPVVAGSLPSPLLFFFSPIGASEAACSIAPTGAQSKGRERWGGVESTPGLRTGARAQAPLTGLLSRVGWVLGTHAVPPPQSLRLRF